MYQVHVVFFSIHRPDVSSIPQRAQRQATPSLSHLSFHHRCPPNVLPLLSRSRVMIDQITRAAERGETTVRNIHGAPFTADVAAAAAQGIKRTRQRRRRRGGEEPGSPVCLVGELRQRDAGQDVQGRACGVERIGGEGGMCIAALNLSFGWHFIFCRPGTMWIDTTLAATVCTRMLCAGREGSVCFYCWAHT